MDVSGTIGSLADQTSKLKMSQNILLITGVIGAPRIVIGQLGLEPTISWAIGL